MSIDHLAVLRKLRERAGQWEGNTVNTAALDAAIAAMIAAPASEGEDGAVAWQARMTAGGYTSPWRDWPIDKEREPMIGRWSVEYRPLYLRPAAQVAADTPCDMGDLCIGCSPRPDPKVCPEQVAATPKHDEGREAAWEKFISDPKSEGATSAETEQRFCFNAGYNAALATQPAARRVTDEDARKAYAAFCTDKPFDAIRAMRAALESFAQPAEGVSGG